MNARSLIVQSVSRTARSRTPCRRTAPGLALALLFCAPAPCSAGNVSITSLEAGGIDLAGTVTPGAYHRSRPIALSATATFTPAPGSNVGEQLETGNMRIRFAMSWAPFEKSADSVGESSTASLDTFAFWPTGGEVPVTCIAQYTIEEKHTRILTILVTDPAGGTWSQRTYTTVTWETVESGTAMDTIALTETDEEDDDGDGEDLIVDQDPNTIRITDSPKAQIGRETVWTAQVDPVGFTFYQSAPGVALGIIGSGVTSSVVSIDDHG